jgi:hypothetical protein
MCCFRSSFDMVSVGVGEVSVGAFAGPKCEACAVVIDSAAKQGSSASIQTFSPLNLPYTL